MIVINAKRELSNLSGIVKHLKRNRDRVQLHARVTFRLKGSKGVLNGPNVQS